MNENEKDPHGVGMLPWRVVLVGREPRYCRVLLAAFLGDGEAISYARREARDYLPGCTVCVEYIVDGEVRRHGHAEAGSGRWSWDPSVIAPEPREVWA